MLSIIDKYYILMAFVLMYKCSYVFADGIRTIPTGVEMLTGASVYILDCVFLDRFGGGLIEIGHLSNDIKNNGILFTRDI